MGVVNALAYYDTSEIMDIKSFIVLTPGASSIKLFLAAFAAIS
jgi:hypothetical protein